MDDRPSLTLDDMRAAVAQERNGADIICVLQRMLKLDTRNEACR